MLLSVFRGGAVFAVLLEHAAKVIAVGDPHAFGNARDGKIRVDQQSLGATNAVAVEIMNGRHSHVGAKTTVHIIDRKVDCFRQILLGNTIGVIGVDILQQPLRYGGDLFTPCPSAAGGV